MLADPDAENHEDMLERLGLESGDDFDSKEFSSAEVNRRLGINRWVVGRPSQPMASAIGQDGLGQDRLISYSFSPLSVYTIAWSSVSNSTL